MWKSFVLLVGIWGVTTADYGWVSPIIIDHYKMFNYDTHTEFQVKGVAYYPRANSGEWNLNNIDFFTSEFKHVWEPDLRHFKELGINTVRLYAVDPSKNHDEFFCSLSTLGIYAIVGMASSCEGCALKIDEKPPGCYPPAMYDRIQRIYRAFAVYDNVLAFSVGNEYNYKGRVPMACVKALIRDAREYADSCRNDLRRVPIGLVSADIHNSGEGTRQEWFTYFDCEPEGHEKTRAEWHGYNPYVECNPEKNHKYLQSNGFTTLSRDVRDVNISHPIIFTEVGCNEINSIVDGYAQTRAWRQMKWVLEEPMRELFNGAVAYEYSLETVRLTKAKQPHYKEFDAGKWGIGYYKPPDCKHTVKEPCEFVPFPEFYNLKQQLAAANLSTLKLEDFNPDPKRKQPATCPVHKEFDYSSIPSTPDSEKLQCQRRLPKCNGKTGLGALANTKDNRNPSKKPPGEHGGDDSGGSLAENVRPGIVISLIAALWTIRYIYGG